MKIVVINGGATTASHTRGLARTFEEALLKKKLDVAFFDVGVDMLPIFTGEDSQREMESVKKLMSLAEQADGFVICTPEYHNGMSGALKNALDFLGGKHFRGKPVVIGAAAGGGKGGINALNNLRLVMRGVYGLVLPDQFVADPEHFNDSLQIDHKDARERIESIVEGIVSMTGLLSRKNEAEVK